MPKMKTHRGAAKRFRFTKSGKLVRRTAFKSHILEKKSPKRKRGFRKQRDVSAADAPNAARMLGKK
ncbi:MAG: 50S ribosomal protein L35 [Thermoleophilia bacterium]